MTDMPNKNDTNIYALDRFREVNDKFPKTAEILEHKSQGKRRGEEEIGVSVPGI